MQPIRRGIRGCHLEAAGLHQETLAVLLCVTSQVCHLAKGKRQRLVAQSLDKSEKYTLLTISHKNESINMNEMKYRHG